MNFFEQQEQSKQKTLQLIFLFILADIGIVLSVYAVTMFAAAYYYKGEAGAAPYQWTDPAILLCVFIVTQALILGGSFVKIMALSRGGQYVAESLGGRLMNPSTTDPAEKRFVNIVEEMAIASGVSVPMAYVLENEEGINAFAAGYSPDDAVVAVTKGSLKTLTRDELQGVIGHEFSHILNGDMRLNIRLIGFISGIMILATIGYHVLRSGGRSRKGGGPMVLIGLSLIVIGYVGVFFARLIQSAVSRQREYLADASSVQFTRNPTGLANALKKIGGFSKGSKVRAPLAAEASHMFFESPLASFFATHPPLAERIRRIEPEFAGDFTIAGQKGQTLAYDEAGVMELSGSRKHSSIDAGSAVTQVGTVSPEHVEYSAKLLEAIPTQVRAELTDPLGASLVVLALLLDEDNDQKKKQIDDLKKIVPAEALRHMLMLDKAIKGMDRRMRLPMIDLSIPSLRRMSSDQFDRFRQYIHILVESDARMNLFEFCLQQTITHRLSATFAGAPKKQIYASIAPLLVDAVKIISKLAELGHANGADAQKAFGAAVKKLSMYGPIKETDIVLNIAFNDLGISMSNIAAAKPGIKEVVFDACAVCVLSDRIVSREEAELLRAVAYCLNLPMPPFLK